MNIELERTQIIEEIKHVDDEWLLKAIKRLLGLDYDDGVPEEHKQVLNSRIDAFENGSSKTLSLEDVKKRIAGKK